MLPPPRLSFANLEPDLDRLVLPEQSVDRLHSTRLFPRLKELGGSHVLCGLARLIMCLAEVPFFYLSGPLIERMGVRGVIAVAQVAYLTRFIYYSVRILG